ncbi:MAG: PAS domain S-box protein [Alphaproteobacteria bacterium]|nr:PAS domain S-box protein [Alphaproteobacteria bacterium]
MDSQQNNNDFFLEKNPAEVAPPKTSWRSIFLFFIGACYGLLVLWVIHISGKGSQLLAAISVYIYGIMGGYGLLLLNRSYNDADRSRKILTEVLEKSTEAHILVTPDGTTIHANPRFKKLSNQKDTASLDDFSAAYNNKEDIETLLTDLRHRAAAEGSATGESLALKGDTHKWFQITCQYISGRPEYLHWRFDDITRRYQMEAMIREEREKLRDFTDNAPVGFFSVDRDGRFIFANDTLLRLLGTNAESLTGKLFLHDFLATPPDTTAPYRCFGNDEDHQHGEILMKTADEKIFKAAITHSIAKDPYGDIITRSIVYDLTAEQKMRQALRVSEDRFHRLFEEAPVGICLLSSDNIISNANQTLATMMSVTTGELNDCKLADFIVEEEREHVQLWLQDIAKEKTVESHIDVAMKGGKDIYAQIYARRLKVEGSFVLHFIDMTEQRNLERQFTQSQKMQAIGQLAGGVAHDFNNLLTAMIGFCDLLLLRHKPGDPSFADIMQIKQNANRAANLVRQLLAFSRQQTLQPRTLDLTDVLTELSHLMRRLIGVNIELQISHGNDLGLVRADQGQMEQVFINLVVNARDAMPNGGKLEIRTHNIANTATKQLTGEDVLPPGQWVAVDVMDTGTGIPEDILSRIFEPFFSTKEVGAGTGLGLATAYGIVHQTGGHIDVTSKQGKGTTFTIYLPHCSAHDEQDDADTAQEKATPTDLTGSSSILLVEDEDAVRTFSARALSNKGYIIADAPGGTEALEILEEGKFTPDILITDVMMPEMDGTTLAKIVREKYPHIKIIFISGYAEDRFKEHLGESVWFLPKPFTLKQLATKVKEVIEEEA